MKRARRAFLWIALAGTALAQGCGTDARAVREEDSDGPSGASAQLIATWTTSAVHAELGEVEVLLTLREDGSLSMVMVTGAGGRLTFPGTWELQGESLVLRGSYFEPDGENRTRYTIRDDGVLLLEDDTGETEEWSRI